MNKKKRDKTKKRVIEDEDQVWRKYVDSSSIVDDPLLREVVQKGRRREKHWYVDPQLFNYVTTEIEACTNEQETGNEGTNNSEEKENPLNTLNLSDDEFKLEWSVYLI